MKRYILIFALFVACSQDEPSNLSGTWSFTTDEFSATIIIDSEGAVQPSSFTVLGVTYTSINTHKVSNYIQLYSEDGARVEIYNLVRSGSNLVSDHQAYREANLPTPFANKERLDVLILTKN